MLKKTTKEFIYELNDDNRFKLKTGMINKDNPNTVYSQINCWVKLKKDMDIIDYRKIVKKKEKEIKMKLYDNINQNIFYKDKFIVDFNLASSGVMNNKSSFMLCDITLFLKEHKILKKNCQINEHIKGLTKIIIDNVFNKNDLYFSYSSK
jgi:hypothetical protein